jgi:hypothetical protein
MASPRNFRRVVVATLCTALAGLGAAAPAWADVRRCEDAEGHVTYSNQACPSGTAKERGVEQRSAVEVPPGGNGAPATRQGVLKVPESDAATVVPRAEGPGPQSREQSKALVARCDDLVRRIEYGQQDLLTTTGAERASAELGLRRLQDEYQANCARH